LSRTSDAAVLEMRGIGKSFPGVRALGGVDFSIAAGEIHALMGENGAGKSTLMKILGGVYRPDAGEIRIGGRVVQIRSPQDARDAGIGLIHQELSLVPNLTVAQNVFLGDEPRRGGFVDFDTMRKVTAEVLQRLGAPFHPDTKLGALSIAEAQQVEIARAIHRRSAVLIMDEPTASLSARETERLFEVIKRLRDSGVAIVYISHRMDEVYALADRVSVLRDGSYIGTLDRDELSATRLIQMMVGRPLDDFYRKDRRRPDGAVVPAPVVLAVEGLGDGGKLRDCSLELRAGEIVGLSGLVGAGRTELARLIFGADRATTGTIHIGGKPLRPRHPSDAMAAGIAYLPEDRKGQGLFLDMTVRENIAVNVMPRQSRFGWLDRTAASRLATEMIGNLRIRVAGMAAKARGLSGGNQQKLLVARWLAIGPKVLILDEPTRGVDVGAKNEIYRIMLDLAERGVAVLFISSELPEIIGMSDRVLIMREGRLAGMLDDTPGHAISQENVMAIATGASLTHGSAPLETQA